MHDASHKFLGKRPENVQSLPSEIDTGLVVSFETTPPESYSEHGREGGPNLRH